MALTVTEAVLRVHGLGIVTLPPGVGGRGLDVPVALRNGGRYLLRFRFAGIDEHGRYLTELEGIDELMPPLAPQVREQMHTDAARAPMPTQSEEADQRRLEWGERRQWH